MVILREASVVLPLGNSLADCKEIAPIAIQRYRYGGILLLERVEHNEGHIR